MSGEQIVGLTTEELEAMDDNALEAFFAPLLTITRPVRESNSNTKETNKKASEKTTSKVSKKSSSKLSHEDAEEEFQRLLAEAMEQNKNNPTAMEIPKI